MNQTTQKITVMAAGIALFVALSLCSRQADLL